MAQCLNGNIKHLFMIFIYTSIRMCYKLSRMEGSSGWCGVAGITSKKHRCWKTKGGGRMKPKRSMDVGRQRAGGRRIKQKLGTLQTGLTNI